jgi:hypothetical protein
MPDSLNKKAARLRQWRAEHPEESAARDQAWRQHHPEAARELDHKKYITRRDKSGYRERASRYSRDYLVKLAGRPRPDRCEVCNRPGKIHFDHDHACCKYGCSKCFRGWVCNQCNWALGNVNDDPLRLEALAAYLRKQR